MVCEWCVEDKQTLVAQNVLNSNRFLSMAVIATKRSPFHSKNSEIKDG